MTRDVPRSSDSPAYMLPMFGFVAVTYVILRLAQESGPVFALIDLPPGLELPAFVALAGILSLLRVQGGSRRLAAGMIAGVTLLFRVELGLGILVFEMAVLVVAAWAVPSRFRAWPMVPLAAGFALMAVPLLLALAAAGALAWEPPALAYNFLPLAPVVAGVAGLATLRPVPMPVSMPVPGAGLHRRVERAAVEQQVLADDEAGGRGTQEYAGVAEFRRVAHAAGG